MHRIATTPGGWNPEAEGVVFIEQTPAPIALLTAADTEIQTLARAVEHLPAGFPAMRVASLLNLQQQLTIDTYAEDVLEHARIIVLRLLGGRSYWNYGLEVVKEVCDRTQASLLVLPGDDRPDPDLTSHSTVPLTVANQVWRYLVEGGIENVTHALQFLSDACLGSDYQPPAPQPVPPVGLYQWTATPEKTPASAPTVGILFYRAHYLAGNTAPIDTLCQALCDRQLTPVPLFVSSLRDRDVQAEVQSYLQPKEGQAVDLILNTTSFAIAQLGAATTPTQPEQAASLWETLNVPVLQVVLSGGTVEQWQTNWQGLSPRDIAMNVALPEVDGRILSRAVSFKSVQVYNPALETDIVTYEPLGDRIHFVAELAANWVTLRRTPPAERKIALILANYPTKNGRLANGVGLDTPASCVAILQALQQAGYHLENVPQTSDALIQQLTTGVTNDAEGRELRAVYQSLSPTTYQDFFVQLPESVQQAIAAQWGEAPTEALPISGIQLGHVFVGVQPARGYDQDPALNYHAPDLVPTHDYLAFYEWLRQELGVQAIAHVGKHGNLEWLPGKGIALSNECYPEVAFGAIPHLYPFIVNDPGEGTQAKRRSQAVIIDHLTPPLTRAELYGPLQQLETLVDEYYEAQSLDPTRLDRLREKIIALLVQENLDQDLGIPSEVLSLKQVGKVVESRFDTSVLTRLDGYLCELKEAQIRDGLHIFGQCPTGRQLRDLIVAIARRPSGANQIGLTRAIAQTWELDFDPLTADPTLLLTVQQQQRLQTDDGTVMRTVGDAIARLETYAADQVQTLLDEKPCSVAPGTSLAQDLSWIQQQLLPNLRRTEAEIIHLLRGFNGEFVPAGASGAPTRGRADVLPTGRNFYSVDIRAIPTETAWDVGRKAAEALIERYTQEHGEYPKTLGLSMWGTATMRTGGDDIAEALALLGVQPVWQAGRVVDFEILPLSILGRPRVDVTLRISGFFRDAFPNLISLFDQAVMAVAELEEAAEQNPLAAIAQQEAQAWQQQGLTQTQAERRSRFRIFGSKPGAYGAGLQGLIEAQNWQTDADLAQAYINWSSYAYTGQGHGASAPEAFEQRLQQMQIVLHNQDNREHDLLDSDDYYQFQGGLTAAVRSRRGKDPVTYFGDHSQPENPRIRRLQEEIARVYRSRVINPKWLAGVMRHGYKGAFEMAATIDYLFAYDATTHCVADYMYEGVAAAYLFNSEVQQFVAQKNPWALRDMAERLLEAHQRGLWRSADAKTLDHLRELALQAEATIESGLG